MSIAEMPGPPTPPTPVSGCPLKRLAVQNGETQKTYDSFPASNSLSLTIEGQRTSHSENFTLVLLVHAGFQRMVSIRLSDLLDSTQAAAGAISIVKNLQRLQISIQEQLHTVIADFDERRDFNVTICMLKKAGFQVRENSDTTRHLKSSDNAPVPSTTFMFEPAAGLGPRLSSITDLQGLERVSSPDAQQNLPFNPSFNGEPQAHWADITRSSPTGSNSHAYYEDWTTPPAGDTAILQSSNSSQLTPYSPYLNPYNVFLGKQNFEHFRPRVSSPLRNSIYPGEPIRQLSNPNLDPQLQESLISSPPLHRTMSTSLVLPSTQENGRWEFRHDQNPIEPPIARTDLGTMSADRVTRAEPPRQNGQTASTRDFCKLLPQPRDLPFAQQPNKQVQQKSLNVPEPNISGPPSANAPADMLSNQPKRPASGGAKRKHEPEKPATGADRKKPATNTSKRNKDLPAPKKTSSPSKNDKDSARPISRARDLGMQTRSKSTQANKDARCSNSPAGKQTKPAPYETQEVGSSTSSPRPKRAARNTKSSTNQSKSSTPPRKMTSRKVSTGKVVQRRSTLILPNSVNAECQTDSDTPVTPPSSKSLPSSEQDSPRNVRALETPLLITDSLLRQVNGITSKILDQYEADVGYGRDEEASAQFYLDQIMTARQDFWHNQLLKLESEM